MLIILACLAGVALGLTFNVLVLLPLALAGGGAYALMSMSVGLGLGATGTSVLVLAFALEAGYMIGLTSRDMVAQTLMRLNIGQSKRV